MGNFKGRSFIAKNHLCIIIAENTTDVVIVNISSYRKGSPLSDNSCILHKGDHGFIKHDSFVVYQKASITAKSVLQKLLDSEHASPASQASDEIINKIIKSSSTSPYLNPKIQQFIIDY